MWRELKTNEAYTSDYKEYIGACGDMSEMPTDCGNFSLFFDVVANKVFWYYEGVGWTEVGNSPSNQG